MSKHEPSSPAACGPAETPAQDAAPARCRLSAFGITTVLHRFGTADATDGAGGTVALHGFTGNGTDFSPLAAAAGSPRLAWIAPDLPGHGKCRVDEPENGYTFEAVDALIEKALARLPPGPRRLLGYSMGGRLALHFAVRHPRAIDRLYLIGASPGIETARAREDRHANDLLLAARIERDGIAWFAPHWEARPIIQTQDNIRASWLEPMKTRRRCLDPAALAHSLRGLGTGAMPSLWDRLPTLHVPTTLFVGETDTKFLDIAREMRSRCPALSLTIVPAAGHCAHLENPKAFLDVFSACLDRRQTPDA
ncbi:MAG: 2-succinyl-6-hydroxy-2,4-cyclohexadiene-1-carboxylate synthase [Opitutales bacterium]|nr:2-succinyl-6-hydroxy-2,4-cyclohexadiene-1-carboxylate synthase [Opitutales bacterium]